MHDLAALYARRLAPGNGKLTDVGLGIDEKTAVIVTGGVLEVVGASTVAVVDARRATHRAAAPGACHVAAGISLHVLDAGCRYDLQTGARLATLRRASPAERKR